MTISRTFAAVGLGLTLVLTGCGDTSGDADFDSEGVEFETEDCDREDALKGERECSASQIKKAREDAAKKKATTRKSSRTGTSKTTRKK